MGFNPGLKQGEIITNDELRQLFGCGNMGGMRRSLSTNTLVIISDHTKELYEDRWKGEILYYIGMGKKGDQSLDKTQNKTLNESKVNGVDVHLFEVFEANNYIYRGKVELADEPYQEKQKDEEGKLRNVWVFPVKVLDEERPSGLINKEVLKRNYEWKEKRTKGLSDSGLRIKAIESQAANPSRLSQVLVGT